MKRDLTTGPIPSQVFMLSWPMIIGIFAVMGFNLVDAFFIAMLGDAPLAAITFTFPVVMLIGSIAFGLGIGLSSQVSRMLGAGNRDAVPGFVTNTLILSVVIVSLLTVIGILTIEPVFLALGASPELLVMIESYMFIWYLNIFFVIVPMVGNGAIRATGDTLFPAIIMVIAGGVNLILDPILIFGWGPVPALGLEGAAIATVISRVVTLAAALYVLHFREHFLVRPKTNAIKQLIRDSKALLEIAVPASLANAITPISLLVITALIASYGEATVAGFGIAMRVEGFLAVLLVGVAAGIGPFVGQNFGRKVYRRIGQSVYFSNLVGIAWALLSFVAIIFFSQTIAGWFTSNEEVIDVATGYLTIVIITLAFEAIMLNVISAFNAIGKAKYSLLLSLFRMVVVYLPLAYLFSFGFGVDGIFWAAAISNILSGALAYVLFNREQKKWQETDDLVPA